MVVIDVRHYSKPTLTPDIMRYEDIMSRHM
jgi:hypothetical protein